MLNYYKRNYPREPYKLEDTPIVKVKAPVLMIHGLKDQYCSLVRSTIPGSSSRTI